MDIEMCNVAVSILQNRLNLCKYHIIYVIFINTFFQLCNSIKLDHSNRFIHLLNTLISYQYIQ